MAVFLVTHLTLDVSGWIESKENIPLCKVPRWKGHSFIVSGLETNPCNNFHCASFVGHTHKSFLKVHYHFFALCFALWAPAPTYLEKIVRRCTFWRCALILLTKYLLALARKTLSLMMILLWMNFVTRMVVFFTSQERELQKLQFSSMWVNLRS